MLQIQPKTFTHMTLIDFLTILEFLDASNEDFFNHSGIKCSLCLIRLKDPQVARESEAFINEDIQEDLFMLDTAYL